MFKWVKIVKSQYFGCWLLGIIFFVIQELPYLVMPLLHLEVNPIMQMPTNSIFLDGCEKILGVLCVGVLILVVNKDNELFAITTKSEKIFFGSAVIVILLNFLGWGLYFCGWQNVAIMIVFLFALPPLYYLLLGLWRKNYFLVALSNLFLIIHLANGLVNLL